MSEHPEEASLELKALLFSMHSAGYSQESIAAFLGKSKTTVNALLRPLQKGKKLETN